MVSGLNVKEGNGMQTKQKSYKGLIYILLVLLSLFMLVPFYWMVISSLKLNKDVFSIPMKWWPDSIHWNNYQIIWKKLPLTTFFLNTAKLTICTTVIQLFTSCLAAYGFTKTKFKGRDLIFLMYVTTIAVPWQVYMIPQFILISKMGLNDTHIGPVSYTHLEENSTNQWVTNFIMTNPVVVGVDGPYRETYDELAVKFYEGNKLDYYSAVLEKASKKTQNTMIDRAYQEKNIPCFSLSDKLLTTEERRQYLKKAYQDDQVPFFSILMDETDGDLLKETGEQAYQ